MVENISTKDLQEELAKRIPTLDDCLSDPGIVPDWDTLSETIYQHEKMMFHLKQMAAGYYWMDYSFETPDPRKRMEEEGVKVNQQLCRGTVLPEKAFCCPELEKKFGGDK